MSRTMQVCKYNWPLIQLTLLQERAYASKLVRSDSVPILSEVANNPPFPVYFSLFFLFPHFFFLFSLFLRCLHFLQSEESPGMQVLFPLVLCPLVSWSPLLKSLSSWLFWDHWGGGHPYHGSILWWHWTKSSVCKSNIYSYILHAIFIYGFCCAVHCCTMLCCTVLCCAALCCAALCCAALCCAMLCCTMLRCTVLCCAALCCAMLCCTMLCCTVLCCAVLCCAVLCCTVLYCVVLCCAVYLQSMGLSSKFGVRSCKSC